ncbi:MAG: hypothetical protein R2731_10730 [Nocardioides sp.]
MGGALLGVVLSASPATSRSTSPPEVVIEVSPASSQLVLGGSVDLTVRVTNSGSTASAPMVLHLDVTDVAAPGSVDPEDWTTTLTKPLGVVAPGATESVRWRVQPISGGAFSVYAVALPDRAGVDGRVASSNLALIQAATRRSLNPQGVLPVSLAVPGLVGILLLRSVRRRRGSRSAVSVGSGPGIGDP